MIEAEYSKQLGERIRALREKRSLTQEQLAEKAKISVKHISNIERGAVKASLQYMTAVANALEIPFKDLLEADHLRSHEELLAEIHRLAAYLNQEQAQIVYRMLKMFTDR
ncbi:helix-turn-helix domain-containing protein [Desulfovibrio sp. OttesenSCG-928-O18]|nr:helix-turn-helix domain-containing protein [Desulfovibrio sp. OttesenSCG-928-O18]